ncbi:hypothetical protein NLG97_g4134 [Lecanicillium saksenae]|uniref:Uncharacterized protein n=1 Tax=Lecanicillium saksenae TaxID=468837 RepID=A0ACC1QWQ1_9HYPO|nr:hypothetical protein NLG97_g4134 [Lecanicillium saksenae]
MAPTNQDLMPQYPDGHFGSLSAEQQEALDKFKSLVVERGYSDYEQATPTHEIKLLRFLRARRWDVEAAYTQFNDTEKWRSANEIDKLYETIDSGAYKELRMLYPQWIGRRDRTGAPVYVWRPQSLTGAIVAGSEKLASKPEFSEAKADGKTTASLICFAALYENLLRFTQPLSTELVDRKHAEVPITLSTYIMDVSGVSVLQFWSLKNHIHTLAFLASAYYPETLGTIFIVGAPPFFSTVFGWIKGWLDPVTVSKIRIVGRDEVLSSLEEVVEKSHIPKQYGGELEYTFGDAPALDPALKDTFAWSSEHSSFPLAPLIWEPVEGSADKVACLRVGSDNGQVVRETVCTIPHGWRPREQNGATTRGRLSAQSRGRSSATHAQLSQASSRLTQHCFALTGVYYIQRKKMSISMSSLATGPPFSLRVLDHGDSEHATSAGVETGNLLKLLPAIYRDRTGSLRNFKANVQAAINREFDLSRVASLQPWLWLAGPLLPPRPLHLQMVIDREITVNERLDMHLVWTSHRVFIKPMPRFLLEPAFWAEYLQDAPAGDSNRPQAIGFLLSYAAMLCYESDFELAKEKRLMPPEVQWSAWRELVQELDVEGLALRVHPRFSYGELKLSHLDLLVAILLRPFGKYLPKGEGVRPFLSDKFAWLAALTAYVVIVLTALQVGLATDSLGHDETFQSVSYGFTVFSILWPFVAAAFILVFFGGLIMVNLVQRWTFIRRIAMRRAGRP